MSADLPFGVTAAILILGAFVLRHVYKTIKHHLMHGRTARSNREREQEITAYLKAHFDL